MRRRQAKHSQRVAAMIRVTRASHSTPRLPLSLLQGFPNTRTFRPLLHQFATQRFCRLIAGNQNRVRRVLPSRASGGAECLPASHYAACGNNHTRPGMMIQLYAFIHFLDVAYVLSPNRSGCVSRSAKCFLVVALRVFTEDFARLRRHQGYRRKSECWAASRRR